MRRFGMGFLRPSGTYPSLFLFLILNMEYLAWMFI